jgi:hypothetical protein
MGPKTSNPGSFTDLTHVQIAGHDGGPLVIRWQRDESRTLGSPSKVIEIEAHEPDPEFQD